MMCAAAVRPPNGGLDRGAVAMRDRMAMLGSVVAVVAFVALVVMWSGWFGAGDDGGGSVHWQLDKPVAKRNRNESFAIMSLPRSGSSYMQTMLDSHSDVLVFPEIFSGNYYDAILPANSTLGAEGYVHMFVHDHRALCSYGFCDPPRQDMFGDPHTSGASKKDLKRRSCPYCSNEAADEARIVGFKVISSSSQLPLAHQALHGRKILVLLRREIVMRCLSGIHMNRAHVHRLEDPSSGYTSKKRAKLQQSRVQPLERVGVSRVLSMIQNTLRLEKNLLIAAKERSNNVLTVWYEDMLAGEGHWDAPPWRAVFDFLDIPPQPLITPLMKIHTSDSVDELYPDLPRILDAVCKPERLDEWRSTFGATPDRFSCDTLHKNAQNVV